jgi:polyketide biosynthesis enoyl-CoA hydratase PksH
MGYATVDVTTRGPVCRLRLARADSHNSITPRLLDECLDVLDSLPPDVTVVVLEGGDEYFCVGAELSELGSTAQPDATQAPAALYELLLRLASGPFVSVAHVRGQVTAGGVGLVVACDLVIARSCARFRLSELLFGLYPACVLPFLIRRCGFRNANVLTLTTLEVTAEDALRRDLADFVGDDSDSLLRTQLTRLRCLPATGIARYKRYVERLDDALPAARALAVEGNAEVFSDPVNIARIRRYVDEGILPWE